MKALELNNKTFGLWTVIKKDGLIYNGQVAWLCECRCGTKRRVSGSSLVRGLSKSCGCLNKKALKISLNKQIEKTCIRCGNTFIVRKRDRNVRCSDECKRLDNLERVHKKSQESFDDILRLLYNRTKTKAKQKNIKFDLTLDFIKKLFIAQNKKCVKTKIPFVITKGKGINNRSPWSVSIDKIIPKKGYVKSNVQLVCIMYNLCKGTWTHSDVIKFAQSIT